MNPEAIKQVTEALKLAPEPDRDDTVYYHWFRDDRSKALALLAAEQDKAPPDREIEEAIIGWRVAKTSGDAVRITIVGDALAALLRRLSLVTAGEWQPIETAPKDGTEIDVWIAASGVVSCRVPNCHWHCGMWLVWGHDPEIGWLNVETTTGCEVTRWMPLPEPPK